LRAEKNLCVYNLVSTQEIIDKEPLLGDLLGHVVDVEKYQPKQDHQTENIYFLITVRKSI
jgi:hypothetical protein